MPADVFDLVRPPRVAVTCHGRSWELSLGNAYQWLGAMGHDMDGLTGVFPGSVGDNDVGAMFQLAMSDPDIDRRWLNAARVAVGRGGGRDWWWTVNLCRKVLGGWAYVNGNLLLSGVNCRLMPLPDWLDACYMMLWRGGDDNSRVKLDAELSLIPAGVRVRQSGQQKRKMLADFAAD